MIVVGIDYSMSSPAICVHTGKHWSFDNCQFHYLTSKKKYSWSTNVFDGSLHKDFLADEQRFDNIATWAISRIPKESIVGIEGYAYAAKGVVFHIGENTGLLKHYLWQNKFVFDVFSPPTIKKFASGKGNANKLVMHSAFVEETGCEVDKTFGCSPGDSPISDIVDSYYIAKYTFSKIAQ